MKRLRLYLCLLFLFCSMLAWGSKKNSCPSSIRKTAVAKTVTSSPLDQELAVAIERFRLRSLQEPAADSRYLIRLGQSLFDNKELSGPRNISCRDCHLESLGTTDGLPLSIGHGAIGLGMQRRQGRGSVLQRNTPPLFNLGYPEVRKLFWDGRVAYKKHDHTFLTPEAGLNGESPLYSDLTNTLSDGLAAQVLFPLVNRDEMLGHGGNDLASAKTMREAWDKIVNRLISSPYNRIYTNLLKKSYPDVKEYNIAHFANAMAAYIRHTFKAIDTPYDRYLRGDLSALTEGQKRGLKVFTGRGKCVSCHNGPHLSPFAFASSGSAQIYPEGKFVDDTGRFEISEDERQRYFFRIPPLRNIALTGPYMHDGSIETLEELVEHYNNVGVGLQEYQVKEYMHQFYNGKLTKDEDPGRNARRTQAVFDFLREGLNLSSQEKADLVDFLRHALTDTSFLDRL